MRLTRAVAVAAFVALWGGTGHAGSLSNPRTIVTFGSPVALPGVTLTAGTYTFALVDADVNEDAVVVLNEARTQVYYFGMTKRVRRPAALARDQAVTFGPVQTGGPVPVLAWFPLRADWGHAFIYSER